MNSQAVQTIERAECSHAYSAQAADGEKLVFWRQWGAHEAYMNVRGKLTKLTYIDPGEYPEDKRLPYRQSWVGEGVSVTIQVTQEAFCAPDEEECDGVEQEGVIAVESKRSGGSRFEWRGIAGVEFVVTLSRVIDFGAGGCPAGKFLFLACPSTVRGNSHLTVATI